MCYSRNTGAALRLITVIQELYYGYELLELRSTCCIAYGSNLSYFRKVVEILWMLTVKHRKPIHLRAARGPAHADPGRSISLSLSLSRFRFRLVAFAVAFASAFAAAAGPLEHRRAMPPAPRSVTSPVRGHPAQAPIPDGPPAPRPGYACDPSPPKPGGGILPAPAPQP